jgi:hypothetical protein
VDWRNRQHRAAAIVGPPDFASVLTPAQLEVKLRHSLVDIPDPPAILAALLQPGSPTRSSPLLTAARSLHDQLRVRLFSGELQLRRLRQSYAECVLTSLFAAQLARSSDGDAYTAAAAGALHNAADGLAWRAIGEMERASEINIDPGLLARAWPTVTRRYGERLAQHWALPPLLTTALEHWPFAGMLPAKDAMQTLAKRIYWGRQLALESLYPDLSAPGLDAALAAQFGFDAAQRAALRAEARNAYMS